MCCGSTSNLNSGPKNRPNDFNKAVGLTTSNLTTYYKVQGFSYLTTPYYAKGFSYLDIKAKGFSSLTPAEAEAKCRATYIDEADIRRCIQNNPGTGGGEAGTGGSGLWNWFKSNVQFSFGPPGGGGGDTSNTNTGTGHNDNTPTPKSDREFPWGWVVGTVSVLAIGGITWWAIRRSKFGGSGSGSATTGGQPGAGK